jgi:hypothetical protein
MGVDSSRLRCRHPPGEKCCSEERGHGRRKRQRIVGLFHTKAMPPIWTRPERCPTSRFRRAKYLLESSEQQPNLALRGAKRIDMAAWKRSSDGCFSRAVGKSSSVEKGATSKSTIFSCVHADRHKHGVFELRMNPIAGISKIGMSCKFGPRS